MLSRYLLLLLLNRIFMVEEKTNVGSIFVLINLFDEYPICYIHCILIDSLIIAYIEDRVIDSSYK